MRRVPRVGVLGPPPRLRSPGAGSCRGGCWATAAGGRRPAEGFTITEAVVALGLTLMVGAGFGLLLRQARLSFELQPELAAMRQDGRAVLDRIAADLGRAGSGLPVEIPVFTDLDRAGNGDPDGLDFLAAPERSAEVSFEPVVGFDGARVTLGTPESRLDRGPAGGDRPFAVVFNDDEMTPRWAFGRVASVRAAGGLGRAVSSSGAVVRIAPVDDPWHVHFRPGVDADTFAPGSGGGLLERGLQSVLGGVIEAAVPGIGRGALSSLTDQVVGQMLQRLLERRGQQAGRPPGGEDADGYGLFGLGQPGLVEVERIRYWVRAPAANAEDGRRVLMRRVNEDAPQPVGFVEDLQVRYVTDENGDVLLDAPPRFAGDMSSAARLRGHVVRAVDVAVRVRSLGRRLAAAGGSGGGPAAVGSEGFLNRTYARRVALRVATAGVERRAWEELMQLHSLPTEIPRIGPLRFLPLPW